MKSFIWSTVALMAMVAMAPAADEGSESPADKLKRQKAEKAAQDKLDAEKAELEAKAKAEEDAIKRDNEILAEKQRLADAHQAEVDKAAAAAMNGAGDGEEAELRPGQVRAAESNNDERAEAIKTLENLALSYPLTTPDSHTIFGFAGIKFTLGDLRAIFNLRRS